MALVTRSLQAIVFSNESKPTQTLSMNCGVAILILSEHSYEVVVFFALNLCKIGYLDEVSIIFHPQPMQDRAFRRGCSTFGTST